MGINVDFDHPNGRPTLEQLGGIKLVRFPIKIQRYYGRRESIEQGCDRIRNYVQYLVDGGVEVIGLLTHQTGFEGWRDTKWEHFVEGDWHEYTNQFSTDMGVVVNKFRGLIELFQVGNEHDTSLDEQPRRAISLTPAVFGSLYAKTRTQGKAVNSTARFITGGLKTGPVDSVQYFQRAGLNKFNVDYVGLNQYGRGVVNFAHYKQFGLWTEVFNTWGKIVPLDRLFLTEWGVLDNYDAPALLIEEYVRKSKAVFKTYRIAGDTWYAFGRGQDNGWGLWDGSVLKTGVRDALADGSVIVIPKPEEPKPEFDLNWVKVKSMGTVVTVRSEPVIHDTTRLTSLQKGDILHIHRTETKDTAGWVWNRVYHHRIGKFGWIAGNYPDVKFEYLLDQGV